MATSTVARAMAALLSLSLLAGSGMLASAQSVQPSNDTLPTTESKAVTSLRLTGGPVFDTRTYYIAPLTEEMGKGQNQVRVGAIAISGPLKIADYTTAANITSSEIALISCDPNGSNIDASDVVQTACDQKPQAIVLYSLETQACNLTGSFGYTSLFSTISASKSRELLGIAGIDYKDSNSLVANIGVNNGSTTLENTPPQQTPDPGAPGGPAPTTAVAMSILYSITGIITLLFLVIIATGAIRAHRHPERYGPRNGFAGRPRQSRAKGLARAMLETLPIVKFGDPEPVKNPNGDVELEDGTANSQNSGTVTGTNAATVVPAESNKDETKARSVATATAPVESGIGAAQAESVKSGEAGVPKEGELGCSICTEDFTTGEDVRVLPCDHRYHPACIDPWLLNVSGTCPLCRHDLRPVTSITSNTDGELPPPLSANEGGDRVSSEGSAHQRRRVSRFLDLNRLRHAPPEERIAALRQLREAQRAGQEPVNSEDIAEEPSRRARLTNRLRDTFRIKTRAQNDTPS
ncbi:hypothetical protein ONS95_010405 [Cadophora gregata]|uniref:uncharacterized protein n=1 Tax=Cadophora gregata TaxID=51156 RepID=UPI0026DA8F53|nr:uncharacterized protein ONS95_010405 [Cadophora gregata]KAK0122144.1 hypothetical protein ONS95_010405 [Cadophora gregata]KAK0127626.1 hypothetical protein ONS96_007150 [Cadophora gregata f. sp. sojae]